MSIQATAVWRVRQSGSNTNGGGYDASISGAGTDYSQQNAAQASGTAGTSSGTTNFTDAIAGAFTSAMVGNALYLTGTGFTTGFYFVAAYISANAVTLDRSPGTGTVGVWHLGGGWAEPFTNITSSNIFPGNKIYVRGSGTDSPTSDDYARGAGAIVTVPAGDFTSGNVQFIGENGRPRISANSQLYALGACTTFKTFYTAATAATAGSAGIVNGGASSTLSFIDCVWDQAGYDTTMLRTTAAIIGGEFYSSVAPIGAQTNFALYCVQEGNTLINVNIHDTVGPGVRTTGRLGNNFRYNLFSKCRGDGLTINESTATDCGASVFANNTFDANLGHAIEISGVTALEQSSFLNNIISNHVTAGKYGIHCNFLTTAQNDRIKGYYDFNAYYGNTNDLFQISHGANDTSSDPQFGAQATEGYNIGTNLKAAGVPAIAFLNSASAFTPTVTQAYIDMGGVQRQEVTGVTVSCTLGSMTEAGLSASVLVSTNVSCSVGTITEAGLSSSVSISTIVSCGLGIFTDAGLFSNITITTFPTDVNCALGSMTDSGLPGQVILGGTSANFLLMSRRRGRR